MRGGRRPVRGLSVGVAAAALSVAAGCSSSPASDLSTTSTTGHRAVPATSSTTTTTTTTPPTAATTTTVGIETATVKVQISGPSATIDFVSSSVTGSLSPANGSFSQGGTVYAFPVTGVQYTGAPSTTSATGGLIASVTVAAASAGGVTVTVDLTSAASHASLGLGHDEVGVQFS